MQEDEDIYGIDPYKPSLLRRIWIRLRYGKGYFEPYVSDNSSGREFDPSLLKELIEKTGQHWQEETD